MHALHPDSQYFKLPPDVQEFCDMAKRVVRDELLPLEQQFMSSPNQAYGQPEIMMIRRVFPGAVAERLEKISRDTGLWYMMVPEEYGGPGLSMLAQVAVMEQLRYSAVPLPMASVGNIL